MDQRLKNDLILATYLAFIVVAVMVAIFAMLLWITQPANAGVDEFVRNNCGVTPASPECRGVEREPLVSAVPPQTNSQSYSTCVVVAGQLYCARTQPAP